MAQKLKHDADHYAFLLRCERRTHRLIEMRFANLLDRQEIAIKNLNEQLDSAREAYTAVLVAQSNILKGEK